MLNAIALALVVALLVGAVMSAAAMAGNFTSSESETTIAAGQQGEHEFVVNTGVVVCEVAHFTGTQVGTTTSTVTVTPSYSSCEFEGLFTVTVNVNGCDFVLHASSATEGSADLAGCNESVPYIQVGSTGTCRIRIPEQTGGGPIDFEEVGNNVTAIPNVEDVEYIESGLFCAGGSVGNGMYFGTSEAQGNGGSANLGVES